MKVWINNRIVDEKDAKVSVFDRGFLYGDGVFETMRGYNSAVFKIGDHLTRLRDSLYTISLKIPHSRSLLTREIYRLIKINKLKDAYIRLTVTRGEGTIGLSRCDCENPTVVIIAKQFTPYPALMYRNGIEVKIVDVRQNELSPASGIKSISFLNYILARIEAKQAGFDDAVLVNSRGHICEATVSNICMVRRRALMTPRLEDGLLPGITRGVILALAPRVGLKARETTVTRSMLYNADEVFLTNSLMEVMPVVKVDNKIIGSGLPGLITHKLSAEYKKRVYQKMASSMSR